MEEEVTERAESASSTGEEGAESPLVVLDPCHVRE